MQARSIKYFRSEKFSKASLTWSNIELRIGGSRCGKVAALNNYEERNNFGVHDIIAIKEIWDKQEIPPYDNEDRKFIMDYFDKKYRDYMNETSGVELPPGALWEPCHIIK